MDGLRVFRADGSLSFDLNYSLARIIGSVIVNSPAGSIDVPQWSNGRPWFFAAGGQARYYVIDGTTLSWLIVPGGTGATDKVYYGIW